MSHWPFPGYTRCIHGWPNPMASQPTIGSCCGNTPSTARSLRRWIARSCGSQERTKRHMVNLKMVYVYCSLLFLSLFLLMCFCCIIIIRKPPKKTTTTLATGLLNRSFFCVLRGTRGVSMCLPSAGYLPDGRADPKLLPGRGDPRSAARCREVPAIGVEDGNRIYAPLNSWKNMIIVWYYHYDYCYYYYYKIIIIIIIIIIINVHDIPNPP